MMTESLLTADFHLTDNIKRRMIMKKWRCVICDYIHEGPEPPDVCPECGAGSDSFEEIV
jgi:rubrerythrin